MKRKKLRRKNSFLLSMNAREQLGKRILFLRKQQGMTQNDLAFKSGLGREYISTVECGKRNISIDAIEKISFALELPLKDLFDFEAAEPAVRQVPNKFS